MKLLSICVTAGCLLLGIATSHADLGDSYATSCRRYGGPGLIDRQNAFITWSVGGTLVSEQFHNDQCVAIIYGSYGLTEALLWQLLRTNALTTQYWREYADPHPGRSFATTDDRIYGKYVVWSNGWPMLRLAYKSWLNRHGFLTYSQPHAPVEERLSPERRSRQAARLPVARHKTPANPTQPPKEQSDESRFLKI